MKKALIIASDPASAGQVRSILEPFAAELRFSIHEVPAGTGALEVVQTVPYDLLAVAHPLVQPPLSDLLRSVRWAESKCRSAAVMVFGSLVELGGVEELRTRGVNRIVPYDAPRQVIHHALTELLQIAPRVPLKTMLKVEMLLDDGTERRMAQTDNLSTTGMLVHGRSRHPEGTTFRFEMTPPGELRPIKGTAEVVRATAREREGIDGFAARFNEFEGDGRDRLRTFLDRQAPAR